MITLAQTTAVILAGGLGTRLRDVLPDTPKVLADVGGRPFITILLERLINFGVRQAVLCTGYLGHLVEKTLGNTYGPLSLKYSQEPKPLDTAGAIANARHLLPATPLLVMNGDSYCHTDLKAFYAGFQEGSVAAALLLTQVDDTGRYGRVEINASGYITAFNEKISNHGPGLISAGIYIIDPVLIESIPPEKPWSLEKNVFPKLADGRLAGFPTQDAFIDIGTGDDYKKAAGFFAALDGQT